MRLTVVLDCRDPDALVEFWSVALGYTLSETMDEYRVLVPRPSEPAGPVLVLETLIHDLCKWVLMWIFFDKF